MTVFCIWRKKEGGKKARRKKENKTKEKKEGQFTERIVIEEGKKKERKGRAR